MEKKNHLEGDLRRLHCKHGKLLKETEKVPYSQKEVAKTVCFGSVVDIQKEGGIK